MSLRVIDANVAIKWVLDEEGSEEAIHLLESTHELTGPSWMLVEVTNILWKRVQRGDLTAQEAQARLRALLALAPLLQECTHLLSRAHDLGVTLGHPVYDLIYLALAERDGGILVTADERLLKAVKGTRWADLVERL